MFAWLQRFRRERALPENPTAPVRVDFEGTVVSPNNVPSPVSDFVSSLIEIALYDHTVRNDADIFRAGESPDGEHFTLLGEVRLGSLVVRDDSGRDLHIEDASIVKVVPLSTRPIPLDSPLTGALAEIAKTSRHILMVRETRFRSTDTVRVRATVAMRERPVAGGYRDTFERILVPIAGEPLVLREML
ncbi:MAG TPA: hypothetical protein VGH87_18025 [Polyangiaceae bacterium]|jgi:hypothetical protein